MCARTLVALPVGGVPDVHLVNLGERHRVADGIVAVVEQQLGRTLKHVQTIRLRGRIVSSDDHITCARTLCT